MMCVGIKLDQIVEACAAAELTVRTIDNFIRQQQFWLQQERVDAIELINQQNLHLRLSDRPPEPNIIQPVVIPRPPNDDDDDD